MVKARCKKCGMEHPVEDFVLDNAYRMMVCSKCSKERKSKELAAKNAPQAVEKKPAGWDADDELLSKAYAAKTRTIVGVERVDNEGAKYKCPKCKYEFVVNIVTKKPSSCPYCSSPVVRFRVL